MNDLKQQLLEWQYGLLSDEEAAELQRLIDASPEAAQQAEEVRAMAGKLAHAARLDAVTERRVSDAPHIPSVPSITPSSAPSRTQFRRSVIKTLLALTCVWLVAAFGGDWWFDYEQRSLAQRQQNMPPQPGLRLIAKERADVVGTQSSVDIETRDERGQARSAKLQARVIGNGRELLTSDVETDNFGRANFTLPASLKLPREAKIIFASHSTDMPPVTGELKLSPTKFITQISFDKLLYRPGEVVRFRSLTVERFSLKPGEKQQVKYKLLDPSGATLLDVTQGTAIGVAAYEWPIPATQIGGTYTVECSSVEGFFPTQKKTFHIQQYRAPRFKKDLVFTKDSYGPGDLLKADFSALRSEGGVPKNARLSINATVDGQNVFTQNAVISEAGTAAVQFSLPAEISSGDGRLSIVIDDGGTRETLTRTIPIQLNRIDLVFYPESGDIVSGLENRVYFVARNPQGKPVHVAGRVVNRGGRTVAETETHYDGMGSFTFTPAFGEQYRLQLTQPSSTTADFNLPLPKDEQLAVLSGGRGVFESGEPLELTVWAKTALPQLMLTAYCRGTFVGREMMSAQAGSNAVSLGLIDQAFGVVRVTVWDASQTPAKPLAERLVYRKSQRGLRVEVDRQNGAGPAINGTSATNGTNENAATNIRPSGPNRPIGALAPGEHANLKLKVTNERGEPVSAAVGIAVVDDAVISLTDDEHKEPTLKTHLLVGSELESPEDIEDVEFYVAPEAKSEAALDHLLGTQGWRRFVEKRYDELLNDVAQQELRNKLERHKCGVVDPQPLDIVASLPPLVAEIIDRTQLRQLFNRVSFAVGIVLGMSLLLALALRPRRSSTGVWMLLIGLSAAGIIIGCGGADAPKKKVASPAASPATSQVAADAAPMAERGVAMGEGQFFMDSSAGKDDPGPNDESMLHAPASAVVTAPAKSSEEVPADFAAGGQGFRFRPRRAPGNIHPNSIRSPEIIPSRVILREYAHKHRERKSPDEERSDFTETIFWNPLVIADRNGEATIEFDLSDSVTSFRVLADAHAADGRIGTGLSEIASRLPFHIEPKLPLEVTAGDRIELPVAVVNDGASAVGAKLTLASSPLLKLIGPQEYDVSVEADQRARQHFSLEVIGDVGDAEVKLSGVAGTNSDRVRKNIKVVPQGFPVSLSQSGSLSEGEQKVSLKLPQSWTPGSLNVTLRAFPTPAADVLQGLEGMLREPCGCFEQTTSSNYPNVLVLRYLQSNGIARPDVTSRAKDMLARGYSRLVGYESKSGGFEWFGGDPGHEALTAFGLMEFVDMQPVFSVDSEMLARTTKWLLSRRNGKGGFERNPRHLHQWAVQQDLVDAYVVWSLTETGMKDVLNQLSLELEHVRSLGEKSDDPYVIALAALSLSNAGQTAAADVLLDKLAGKQGADSKLVGRESITQSGGQSLWVETTALAALAWQKRPQFASHAEKAVGWIRSQRSGGGHFGSTQATVLALKALLGSPVSSDAGSRPSNGAIVLRSGNDLIGEATFAADRLEPITISNLGAKLNPGENTLTLSMTGGRKMAFTIESSFRTARPDNDGHCPVTISTRLASEKLEAGKVTTLEAKVTNTKRDGLPMTLAILGIPAGLEVRTAQLDELKDKGVIDYFELRGREVICYWRMLKPEQVIDLKLDLTAEIPGTYTGPASQCYLYYTAEQKHWADPVKVEITKE